MHIVDVQCRLFMAEQELAKLPPVDEVRIHLWLRQLHLYEFRALISYQIDQNASLELAEIRALFRCLIL